VFFVLSGFLITYLLIAERRLTGSIHVPRFWLRRVLRIWPLYYACVFFGFLIFPLLKQASGVAAHEVADPIYYLFFASNFDPNGIPDASTLDVLWSIAVEEQFYLVWPVLLALLPVRRYPWAFGVVMLASWTFRMFTTDEHAIYSHTLSCIGDMATGGLAAWIGSSERGLAWLRGHRNVLFAAYPALLVAYLIPEAFLLEGRITTVFGRTLVALPAALVILHQCFLTRDRLSLPEGGPLAYLGRISYGLYCLHMIGYLAAIQVLHRTGLDKHAWQVLLFQPAVALAVSIGLAALSFRYLERPFLRLKDRMAFIHRRKVAA
ncbi:MAG TPA: acyltransferase, partial [Flavobacteriales bacterium]|jgi:peptidoglycan/LPS O-acetylase OafA/YrhL|nr:acyltransferase [Flavobacteriales bacterium]